MLCSLLLKNANENGDVKTLAYSRFPPSSKTADGFRYPCRARFGFDSSQSETGRKPPLKSSLSFYMLQAPSSAKSSTGASPRL
jgi:hypothetical protein